MDRWVGKLPIFHFILEPTRALPSIHIHHVVAMMRSSTQRPARAASLTNTQHVIRQPIRRPGVLVPLRAAGDVLLEIEDLHAEVADSGKKILNGT